MKTFTKILCGALAVCSTMAMATSSPALVKTSALSQEEDDYYIGEMLSNDSDNNNSLSEQGNEINNSLEHILVFGAGKVTAIPDIAYVTIGVESLKDDLQAAIKENNDIVISLIEHLTNSGIDQKDIKTQNYYVYQKHDYTSSARFLGYQVSNTIEFKTTDLENVGTLISELTDLGANQLGGITFDCQDISTYYQEALKLAISDAKNKAAAISDTPLKIIKVIEENIYTCMPYRAANTLLNEASAVIKGSLDIEAKIKVIFG